MNEQTFHPLEKFKAHAKFAPYQSLLGVLAFVGLAVWSWVRPSGNSDPVLTAVLCSGACIAFGIRGWWVDQRYQRIPLMSITVSDDGIRYTHDTTESGLIPWESIVEIREKQIRQRLELLSENGRPVLWVDFGLEGFEQLREILLNRVPVNPNVFAYPVIFGESLLHYLLLFGMPAIGTCILLYITYSTETMGLCALFSAAYLVLFLLLPIRVTIYRDFIKLSYPIGRRIIQFSDIKSVELSDSVVQKATACGRKSKVQITVQNRKKPIRIASMFKGVVNIYQALSAATNQWEE